MRRITSYGARALAVVALLSVGVFGSGQAWAKQQTATTVTSAPNPSTAGQSVTLTATVASQQGGQINQHWPDAVVQFVVNGANYGDPVPTVQCGGGSSGCATITIAFPEAGNIPVMAIYGGDQDFDGSTSPTITQVVNPGTPQPKVTTTTALVSSSPNGSVAGESVTFTATVSPENWSYGVPTGTVTFNLGNTTLFVGTLNADGWVAFNTMTLPVGSNMITANYSGDNIFNGSNDELTQIVTAPAKAAPSIALVSSPNPALIGEPVWLTATVTPADFSLGTPTGTVTFTSGNVSLTGTLSLGWVTVTTSDLPQGANIITATYNGDNNYSSASTTWTEQVNSPASVSTSLALVAAANPSIAGDPVWLTATVTPDDYTYGNPTGTVTISMGGTTLFNGELNSDAWVMFTIPSLQQGIYTITAVYSGDSHYTGSSATVTQTVNPAPGKIATSLALVASPNPSSAGERVYVTATVTPADWAFGNPTGTVTVSSGNTTLFSGPLNDHDWVMFSTPSLPQGANTLTATYSGDSNYSGSNATLVQTVNPIGTTLVLVASPNPSISGQVVTLTATVSPAVWGLGIPTGSVTFSMGDTTLYVSTLNAQGWLTFNTSTLPLGASTITATYGGDNVFKTSSATVTQTVNAAPSP